MQKKYIREKFLNRSLKNNSLMMERLFKKKQKIWTIRNENIKYVKRQEQLYINLDKMNRVVMKYNLVKLTQEETDNLNILIPVKNCSSNENL